MLKLKTSSNFKWWSGWNDRVVGSWATWFLDFNKRGAWNKRGGEKFGSLLIKVVAEITELWVENSQKINCRDAMSIKKGRVQDLPNNNNVSSFSPFLLLSCLTCYVPVLQTDRLNTTISSFKIESSIILNTDAEKIIVSGEKCKLKFVSFLVLHYQERKKCHFRYIIFWTIR